MGVLAARTRPALAAWGLVMLVAAAAGARAAGVPYVPTPWNVVDAMLALGRVGPADYLIDLGSGDGRIVIAAVAKHGAQGFGVDLDGDLVNVANAEAKRQGVADRAVFHRRDLFDTDLSRASVLTLYLLPGVNLRLRPRLLDLRPGTRIVSHDFDLGDWKPDAERTLEVPEKSYGPPSSRIFLWVVPAKVEGRWRWTLPATAGAQEVDLTLEQQFQRLSGRVTVGGREALLVNPRVEGDRLAFGIVDDRLPRHGFSGRVAGDRIEGSYSVAQATGSRSWSAGRIARGDAAQRRTATDAAR